jgi:hypothetical protein
MALGRPKTQGDNGETLTESEEKAIPTTSSSALTTLMLMQQERTPILTAAPPLTVSGSAQSFLDKVLKASTFDYPAESKSTDFFTITEDLPKTSSHQLHLAHSMQSHSTYYYKRNNPDASGHAQVISEMEAVCASYYQFLSPGIAPETYSVYNRQGKFEGVLSETMPRFVPVLKEPLTANDLNVDFLSEKNLSLPYLETLESKLREVEVSDEQLERKIAALERHEEILRKGYENFFNASRKTSSSRTLEMLSQESKDTANLRIDTCNLRVQSTQAIRDFYKEIEAACGITEKEFTNFRIIKGSAIGMTTSWIFLEDDCHQNNISKFGKRIDFDMSLWPLFRTFCDKNIVDKFIRTPNENVANVSEFDIARFPNMTQSATPYYWPTVASGAVSEFKNRIFQLVFSSSNAYPSNVQEVYKKLEKNPVFIHYVYSTLLKYILTNADMYKKVASLQMGNRMVGGRNLLNQTAEMQTGRIQKFENVLILMENFVNFCNINGAQHVVPSMALEIDNRNSFFKEKLRKLELSLEVLNTEIQLLCQNFVELHKGKDLIEADIISLLRLSSETSTPTASADGLSRSPTEPNPAIAKMKLKQSEQQKTLLPIQRIQLELQQKVSERNRQLSAYASFQKQMIDTSVIQKTYDDLVIKINKGEKLRQNRIAEAMKGNSSLGGAKGASALVRESVITEITREYLGNNSMFSGWNSTNREKAQLLVNEINALGASPVDFEENLAEIVTIRSLIEGTFGKLPAKSGLKTCLRGLLNDSQLWSAITPANKPSLRK